MIFKNSHGISARKSSSLAKFRSSLRQCAQCGICNASCPTFAQTGREGDGPRGKIALLRAFMDGRISAAECAPQIARCALCGKCAKACPPSLPLERIFLAARIDLGKYLFPDSRKYFLAFVFSHPSIVSRLQPAIALGQKILPEKISGYLPSLPARGFMPPSQRERKHKVLLFTGCLSRRLYPEIAGAAVEALNHQGYHVLMSGEEACCGRPLVALGDMSHALKTIRHNLKQIGGFSFERLLTLCPCCLNSIQNLWPSAIGLDDDEKIQTRELARNAIGIAEFLVDKLPGSARKGEPEKRLAWHRPCLEGERDSAASLKLLETAEKLEILMGSDQCCGGSLTEFHIFGQTARSPGKRLEATPETCQEIAISLRDALLATKADGVVTSCPWCILALEKTFSRNCAWVRPSHVMEVYAEIIGGQL